MSLTFYAQTTQTGPFAACLRLAAAPAHYLLLVLDYELKDRTEPSELLAADLLGRIAAVWSSGYAKAAPRKRPQAKLVPPSLISREAPRVRCL
jgi:hypothetical protein